MTATAQSGWGNQNPLPRCYFANYKKKAKETMSMTTTMKIRKDIGGMEEMV
jgi:hypothetical protein